MFDHCAKTFLECLIKALIPQLVHTYISGLNTASGPYCVLANFGLSCLVVFFQLSFQCGLFTRAAKWLWLEIFFKKKAFQLFPLDS